MSEKIHFKYTGNGLYTVFINEHNVVEVPLNKEGAEKLTRDIGKFIDEEISGGQHFFISNDFQGTRVVIDVFRDKARVGGASFLFKNYR